MAVTRMTALGLAGMASLCLLTILLFWLDSILREIYAVLWMVQGPFQSAILLGAVAIMFNWFPPETRGTVMGIWGINGSVGNILGEALTGIMSEELQIEWKWIVTTSAGIAFFAALLLFLFISDQPRPADVTDSEMLTAPLMIRDVVTHKEAAEDYEKEDHVPHLSWSEVLQIPNILFCSLSYSCIKMLNFGLLMWLPYFFEDEIFHMNMEETGVILSFYDFGGIIGCIMGGYLSDKVEKRSSVLILMLGFACPALAIFPWIDAQRRWAFYWLVAVLGSMCCGGSNLMLTGVVADLSQDSGIDRHKESKTAVIGVVSAIGTVGAALGQVIIGELILYGWTWVFAWFLCNTYTVMAFSAIGLLFPIVFEGYRKEKVGN